MSAILAPRAISAYLWRYRSSLLGFFWACLWGAGHADIHIHHQNICLCLIHALVSFRAFKKKKKKKKKKKAEGRRKRCLPCWIVDRVNELFESIHLFLPQKTGFSIPPAHIDIHWDVYARVWLQMVVGDGGYNCRCDACVNWSNYQRKKQRTKRIENYTEIWGSGVVYAFLARQTAPYLGDSFASNRSLDYWNCVSTTNLIKSGGVERSWTRFKESVKMEIT